MDFNFEKTFLGIELGSTRIKAVLIGENNSVLASGAFDWENEKDGIWWTYSLENVQKGLQGAYGELKAEVSKKFGVTLRRVGAIGISAMMHGYIALDENDRLLTPFRTWRNTATSESAAELSSLFGFNIPERWTVSHLRHAERSNEEHVQKISYLTTLAGYVHYVLTGKKVVGVGEASGIFPIDESTLYYDETMLEKFNDLSSLPFKLQDVLPAVLNAGENAGVLTQSGALYLDPSGDLEGGIALCPPEGDAGTGMTATNSVKPLTGNISAVTSVFAMIVLDKALKNYHREIDIVATPSGKNVAMVHCNTCTSDLDSWVKITGEVLKDNGVNLSKGELYEYFYSKALTADKDCAGLVTYNFYSGEPVLNLESGVPTLTRDPAKPFTYSNLANSLIYSAIASLRIGMDILTDDGIKVEKVTGHGGLFKDPSVTQKITASALGTPVAVMSSAGEGGAWGIAVLAKYMIEKEQDEKLEDYLQNKIFNDANVSVVDPDPETQSGFNAYLERYKKGIEIMKGVSQ